MLIKEAEAKEQIEKTGDSRRLRVLRLILDAVREFYLRDPSRLTGDFDLAFLVDVLDYDLDDINTLLLHKTPQGYWDDPSPEWFTKFDDTHTTALRIAQAHSFCGGLDDIWLGYALRSVINISNLKERLMNKKVSHRHHPAPGKAPAAPATPASPLDQLFMVEALHYALQGGSPARLQLEERFILEP